MPNLYSKPLIQDVLHDKKAMTSLLFKNNSKTAITCSVIAIILFLIKLRFTKTSSDNIKVNLKSNKGKG